MMQIQISMVPPTKYISKTINDGNYCIGIFLDIKKAFDCVLHDILLKKLEHLGIGWNPLKWFKSYLSGRSQKCDVNGALSKLGFIDIGVLQGCTLGPILFLCFVNDLPESNLMHSLLFADDTACLVSNKNDLFQMANSELHKISVWFKANKLAVNVKKPVQKLVQKTSTKYLNCKRGQSEPLT